MARPCASVSVQVGNAFVALVAGVLVLAAFQTQSRAQDFSEGETLIGTIDLDPGGTSSVVRPPMGLAGPVTAEDNPASKAGPQVAPSGQRLSEPQRIFADAMDQLAAGRPLEARRLLERVIAVESDGPLATIARYHLAKLYLAADQALPGEQAGVHAVRADPAAKTSELAGPSLPAAHATAVRVSAEVEQGFILKAGDRVFFSAGSADLGSRARAVLAAQARWLAGRPNLNAVIEGHADDGDFSAEQHQALSQARAEAVRDRLVAEGVAPDRLEIDPWGRDRRISNCEQAMCSAQNRRAVTVLVVRDVPGASERVGQVRAGAGAARPNSVRAR